MVPPSQAPSENTLSPFSSLSCLPDLYSLFSLCRSLAVLTVVKAIMLNCDKMYIY